jgi:hypothetical protein
MALSINAPKRRSHRPWVSSIPRNTEHYHFVENRLRFSGASFDHTRLRVTPPWAPQLCYLFGAEAELGQHLFRLLVEFPTGVPPFPIEIARAPFNRDLARNDGSSCTSDEIPLRSYSAVDLAIEIAAIFGFVLPKHLDINLR